MANHVEKLSNMAYQEKQKNLKAFRRQVQKRVSSRERAKEFEIQLQSGNAVRHTRNYNVQNLIPAILKLAKFYYSNHYG